MPKRRAWLDWLLATAMTVALFAGLLHVAGLRYENSDDGLILKAFLGFEGGVPTDFSLYMHTALAWALHALSVWKPGVAWFSLFQVGLLALSCATLGKSFLQLSRARGRSRLPGLGLGALYLALFAAFACCRVNYTTTAALAGAAAVAQFLTLDWRAMRGRGSLTLSLFLLASAYCLRAQGAWPAVAFLALALLWRLLNLRGEGSSVPRRRLLAAGLGVLVLLGGLYGIRAAEIRLRNLQADIAWHGARTALMDFTAFETDPAPALAAGSGLTAAEVEMVRQWYFLDGNLTAETLTRLAEAYPAQPDPLGALRTFLSENPRSLYALGALAALGGLCLVGARPGHGAAGGTQRGNPWKARFTTDPGPTGQAKPGHALATRTTAGLDPASQAAPGCGPANGAEIGADFAAGAGANPADGSDRKPSATADRTAPPDTDGAQAVSTRFSGLCALATLLGLVGFLLLLGWRGRLLARAADAALLPGGAMLVCLALGRALPGRETGWPRRAAAAAFAAALIAMAIPHAQATLYAVTRKPDTVSMQREADLETYALAHPDALLVRSPNLLRDTRLRPDVSAGVPGNILLWGDWTCHTPGWDRQLAAYGLSAAAFSPADWLSAPLLLAVADPSDTNDLRAYLSAALDRPITAEAVAREGTLQFFRFTGD